MSLKIDGRVDNPLQLSFEDLVAFDEADQVRDVSRLDPQRKGDAIRLEGLLQRAGMHAEADYLGLHSSSDDFHASIPLAAVLEKAIVIYQLDGQPLPASAGGPQRLYIPDHAACHTAEIDECANVKFVDHIELTQGRGYDNRPQDDDEHARLHEQ